MSEFITAECSIDSREDLIAALEEIFPREQIEVHDEPQPLFGYQNDRREQTAEVIIRRKNVGGSSNDMGFKWNGEKKVYDAIISAYDRQQGWEGKVKQAYAMQKVKAVVKAAKRQMKVISGKIAPGAGRQKIVIEVSV